MSRRRFYASAESFDATQRFVTLPTEEARHLRDVLRLAPGDRAFVFDGVGHEYECVVQEVRQDFARLNLVSEVAPSRPESPLNLTLAVALLKGEKFDFVVQKSTELGVTRIVPVITKLADIRLRDQSDGQKRVTRWQRIALEAAKQSGRALVPVVAPPSDLATLLETQKATNDLCLIFSERLGKSVTDAIARWVPSTPVTSLVGSEGGWTDEELSVLSAADWMVVTLGGRILRAETAAIIICALLQHRLGDLK
jgi:16S rRNA (uracil1498-N3)-methyltransferase